jgi:hypothetical protein
MNRILFGGVLALALTLAAAGCKREPKAVHVQQPEEEAAPRLASSVIMSNPALEPQLLSGFYGIEGNAWRWTARKFSVALRTPPAAAQSGGVLSLALTVPPVVIEKNRSVTLSAMAGDSALTPETYTKPGQYTYKRDVPPAALQHGSLHVDFSLDKSIPPAGGDLRELGVIVSMVALESK